jgi:transcriptional regulator with XRE-family HTH domain
MKTVTMVSSRHVDYESMRPSEVFARRLRETRKARGLTQTQLAAELTNAGVPISKTALLGIETLKRRVTLDEALAIAAGLNAVPAHMLSPPEGAFLQVDDRFAIPARGVREFLQFGLPWNVDDTPDELLPDDEEAFRLRLGQLAQALVDAERTDNDDAAREIRERMASEVGREIRRKDA